MMSLSLSLDRASAGRIQNGWTRQFQALPSITDMEVWAVEAPRALAASIMNGPWTTQWPPPEGAKKLITNELTRPQNGRVSGVEMLVNSPAMVTTRPEAAMMAMIPA